jgi:hypothetical protein
MRLVAALLASLFSLAAMPAFAADATPGNEAHLSWTAPTLSCDGSPLVGPITYTIYYGTVGRAAAGIPSTLTGGCGTAGLQPTDPRVRVAYQFTPIVIVNPVENAQIIPLAPSGTRFYFAVTAKDAEGESNLTGEVSKLATDPAPTLQFDASPASVLLGGSALLSWLTTNATGCVASGNWSGNKAVPQGSETRTNLSSNSSYTLTCSGTGGSIAATRTVQVIQSFSFNPPVCPTCATFTGSMLVGATGTSITIGWQAVPGTKTVSIFEYPPKSGAIPVMTGSVPDGVNTLPYTPTRAGLFYSRVCAGTLCTDSHAGSSGYVYFFKLAAPTGGGID